jgi:hypothetical protein
MEHWWNDTEKEERFLRDYRLSRFYTRLPCEITDGLTVYNRPT